MFYSRIKHVLVHRQRLPLSKAHHSTSSILQAVFWYLRYSLSYRDIEELMQERGVEVDHWAIQRWMVKFTPLLESVPRKGKKAVDKAIKANGLPEKINLDKSGSNCSAIQACNRENEIDIEIRQVKYLNNLIEQDHRFIQRGFQGMLGFKSFHSATVTLSGIEMVRMIKKGQMQPRDESVQTPA